jgi:hypothetical protein
VIDRLEAGGLSSQLQRVTLRRRSLLAGFVTAGGVLGLSALSAESASAAPARAELKLRVTETLDALVLDEALASSSVLSFPVRVVLGDSTQRAFVRTESQGTARLQISYDARVFSIYRVSIGDTDSAVLTLAPSTVSDGTTAVTAFDVPLGERKRTTIQIGVVQIDGYPSEGVSSPLPTTLTANGSPVASYVPGAATATTAWGLELYPMWSDVEVPLKKGHSRYRFPVGTRVVSVGPTPSPAGLELYVSFDERAVSALSLTESSLTSSGLGAVSYGAASDLVAMALPTIPAGEVIDLRFEATPRTPDQIFENVRQSSLDVGIPVSDTSTYVRHTGRYSVVDLTPSGNGMVEDSTEGRI